MKNTNFLRKLKYFFKRNAYTLAITLCTVLAVTMVSLAAVMYVGEGSFPIINVGPGEDGDHVNSGSVVVFEMPIENGEITKGYAEDHLLENATTGDWRTHQGLDFAAALGTKVLAVYDGTIESVEDSVMDSLVVTIAHEGGLKTVYRCLGSEALVKKGDKVKKGQQIGVVGTNTSEKGDGAHLHLELLKDDVLVDPTPYFSETGK